ncbi:MAG: leucyl aminopeptidase, partial [Rhodobacteraceae bacterium]|nr:leucyl aminopeptidase [Paracoccaceae bacterium]
MSHPVALQFQPLALEDLAKAPGRIALLAEGAAPSSPAAKRLNRVMRGGLARAMASEAWGRLKPGEGIE